jgi:hypothetical protein
MSPRPKRLTQQANRHANRRPNFRYTTLKVCGLPVSKKYDLICLLPPHIPHNTHAAVALGEDEIYTVILPTPSTTQNTQPPKPLIQLKDGSWHPVEELPNESQ